MGVSPFMHYLDDFPTMGVPDASACLQNLQVIKGVCQHMGIPLAVEKVEGPSTSLTFLGIILDTVKMEARLPLDKLQRICVKIYLWLDKKKSQKKANSVPCGFAAARYKGGEARQNLCILYVQGSNETQEAPPRNTALKGF